MKHCKHGQHKTVETGPNLWYAECLNCGMQSTICRSGRQAVRELKSTKGPLVERKKIEDWNPKNKKHRIWTCGMYPETKLALRQLARDLDFNGVIARALVALMSVPNEILVDIVKEHGELYQVMWDLSRSRDHIDGFDPEYKKLREQRLKERRERKERTDQGKG